MCTQRLLETGQIKDIIWPRECQDPTAQVRSAVTCAPRLIRTSGGYPGISPELVMSVGARQHQHHLNPAASQEPATSREEAVSCQLSMLTLRLELGRDTWEVHLCLDPTLMVRDAATCATTTMTM